MQHTNTWQKQHMTKIAIVGHSLLWYSTEMKIQNTYRTLIPIKRPQWFVDSLFRPVIIIIMCLR